MRLHQQGALGAENNGISARKPGWEAAAIDRGQPPPPPLPNAFSAAAPLLPAPQVHLILRHKSPKTGKVEEKHLVAPPSVESDSKTHVYTAILRASNNS